MNRKTLNLIRMIIQGTLWTLLFVPGMFVRECWIMEDEFSFTHKPSMDQSVSFFGKITDTASFFYSFLGWIIIILMLGCTVIYLMQFLNKLNISNPVISFAIPTFDFLALIFCGFVGYHKYSNWSHLKRDINYEPAALIWIMLLATSGLAVVTVLGYLDEKKAKN